jgi:hypothetical protein
MREAVIVVGIAIMLGAGMVVLWSSIELRNIERSQDLLDEFDDLWDELDDEWYPFGDIDEITASQLEKQHDYYSSVRIAGVIGLIAGAIIALYGFLVLKEEPKPSSMSPFAPQATPGATNYCEYCGRQISPDAVWCPGCGRKFKPKGHEGDREQEVR